MPLFKNTLYLINNFYEKKEMLWDALCSFFSCGGLVTLANMDLGIVEEASKFSVNALTVFVGFLLLSFTAFYRVVILRNKSKEQELKLKDKAAKMEDENTMRDLEIREKKLKIQRDEDEYMWLRTTMDKQTKDVTEAKTIDEAGDILIKNANSSDNSKSA